MDNNYSSEIREDGQLDYNLNTTFIAKREIKTETKLPIPIFSY